MDEYQYADCSFCGGPVQEELVTVVRLHKGRIIVIEDVPAGVCQQCGERYYRGPVVEDIEQLMNEPCPSAREVTVPVMKFAVG